jgi:hypothetical protein
MPLRSTILGAASGVVLLAGVFGFAVGLPKVVGDDSDAHADTDASQSAADDRPAADLLPDTILNGALQRYEQIDQKYAKVAGEVEGYSGDKLTEVFGNDSAVGLYATPDLEVRVEVTIYDGESGLFLQTGPPVPPEMNPTAQTISDLLRERDTPCIAQWQVRAYQEKAPPFQVQCQRVYSGRTINVYAAPGLTVEQTVDIVEDIAKQAGLD